MRKVDEGRIIERQNCKRNQKTLARYFLSISFSNWNFNIINNNSQTNLTLFSRNRNIKNIVTLKKTKIKIRRDCESLNFSKFDSHLLHLLPFWINQIIRITSNEKYHRYFISLKFLQILKRKRLEREREGEREMKREREKRKRIESYRDRFDSELPGDSSPAIDFISSGQFNLLVSA